MLLLVAPKEFAHLKNSEEQIYAWLSFDIKLPQNRKDVHVPVVVPYMIRIMLYLKDIIATIPLNIFTGKALS